MYGSRKLQALEVCHWGKVYMFSRVGSIAILVGSELKQEKEKAETIEQQA